jgi:hypothetical protein
MTELKFEVHGNSYTIKVPSPGNMIDVERLKMALSGGYYDNMMRTNTVSAQESLMVIDIQSHFNILCPQLIKDMKCEDISKMTAEDYRELKIAYTKQFIPWWNNWLQLFRGEDEKK